MPVIVSNQVRCKACGDEPWSGSVHDFRSCKCGSISADGGQEYLRRVGDLKNFEDISIVLSEEAIDAAIQEMDDMRESGRNTRGILYGALRALRDNGVKFDVTTED